MDGKTQDGTYRIIGGDAVEIAVGSEEKELFYLHAPDTLMDCRNDRNFWKKANASDDVLPYDGYFSVFPY